MSTLEKQNEIINFIGWREINDTEPEIGVRVRQLHLAITPGNSRIRRKQNKSTRSRSILFNHRNYIYLQDFKYKLNVTLILIEDLRTICTLSYLILWQYFCCLYTK
jgi:hypothetical protein